MSRGVEFAASAPENSATREHGVNKRRRGRLDAPDFAGA
jgi:hypothetical protein